MLNDATTYWPATWPLAAPASTARLFTPYDSSAREFSDRDWERLWDRFLACLEFGVSSRERERLHKAPIARRADLARMHLALGHAPRWRFGNIFEAIACELEHEFLPTPARAATPARPGSIEKIAVLAARIDAGEELYHPDDETIPLCSPVLE